jgi:competence protein ComEC
VVIAYLVVAGARASLVRATLMLLGSYGAHFVGRPQQPLYVLNLIATGMLLLSPELARDLGFLLTVSATAGILGLAPRLEGVCKDLSLPLGKPLSVTIAAQASTLPWVLPAFHFVAPFASLWNLIAVPWITLVFVTSVSWLLALLIQPSIAHRLIPILDLVAAPASGLCELSPRLFQIFPSNAGFWLAAVPVTLLFVLSKQNRALWTVGLSLAIMIPLTRTRVPSDPQLVVLDVGQGEALLVRDGDAAVLVDGGGWRSGDIARSVLLPALSSLGVRRLDGALLTHPDLDHCGGLIQLGRYLELPVVWIGAGWQRSPCLDGLATLPGSRLGALWRGESITVGRWRLDVLHPAAGTIARGNRESLVVLASVMNKRVLLTGDIDAAVERGLVAAQSDQVGRIDILKLAHHGSKTSTSEALLDQARPALGLVSCGVGNRYSHPSAEVVIRLAERGVPVLRTDRNGAIVLSFFRDSPMRIDLPGSPKH